MKEEDILGRKARNSSLGSQNKLEHKEDNLARVLDNQIRYDLNDFKNSGLKTTDYKTTLSLVSWERKDF